MLMRAGKVFFALSLAGFSAVILASSQPPLLRDYPDWVYQGFLFSRVIAGHPVAGYVLKPYPVPNSITTVALGLMTLALGWALAAKLWLVLTLLFSAAVAVYAIRTLEVRETALWWLLPAALFFGQNFWFATVSFTTGLSLLLLLGCRLYRRRENVAGIVAILLACFFTHLIVYAAAFLLLLFYCMEHRRWKLAVPALATTPLAIWYVLGRALHHSNESTMGYAPLSHLAVPVVVATLLLTVSLVWPRWPVGRILGPLLPLLYGCVALAAMISPLLSAARLSGGARSVINLLQLKAIDPFQLFGFVNITYQPGVETMLSSTMTLLHRPAFLALLVIDILAGVVLLGALAKAMIRTMTRPRAVGDDPGFLWDFIALFALVYLLSPPNGLGVIGLDMRLAQLAFGPALFLLARQSSPAMKAAVLPLALLACASLYQFAKSQHAFRIPETDTHLPEKLGHFSSVDTLVIADEYDRMRAGKLSGFIFATGLFIQTPPAE